MLKISLLAFSVFAVQAYACPRLEGAWSCNRPQGGPTYTLTISQSGDAVVTYKIDSEGSVQTVVTDGQPKTESDPRGATQVTTSSCPSENLVVANVHLVVQNPPAVLDAKMSYELLNPSSLSATADIHETVSGYTQDDKQSISCTKN